MKRIFILLSIAFALSQTIGAQEKLRVTPQWMPQAQFAGIYVAQEMGFYREAGVEVEITHPSATRSSAVMLQEGDTDIITAQFIDALINWDKGFRMVNVLQTSENASLLIVSRQDLASPEDLKGRRIGHWKAGFSHLGFIFDRQNKLQAEWIPFHSNIALFISGAIDATLAMEYNEYFLLIMAGRVLGEKKIIAMRDYGLNIQEDGLYVKPDFFKKHKTELQSFVEATKRGWEWARKPENREKAVDIVMAQLARANVHSNRINQQYMLDTILRLQEDKSGTAPYAMSEKRFQEAVSLLKAYGYIHAPVPYADFIKSLHTN